MNSDDVTITIYIFIITATANFAVCSSNTVLP